MGELISFPLSSPCPSFLALNYNLLLLLLLLFLLVLLSTQLSAVLLLWEPLGDAAAAAVQQVLVA